MRSSKRTRRSEAPTGQLRLPKNATTIRRTHRALHTFAEQLQRELDAAIRNARSRQLGAARRVEHLGRFLIHHQRAEQPAVVADAPAGFPVDADFVIGLRYVDFPALSERVDAWSAAIAALEVYEGQPFARKPVMIGKRGGEGATDEPDIDDKALACLEHEANLLLAIFRDVVAKFERRLDASSSKGKRTFAGSTRQLTPPKVAKRLGVSPDKVRQWLDNGELVGTNVASEEATRPRWRIDVKDLEEFEKKRQPTKPAPATKRRRRKVGPEVTEYF